MKFIKERAVKSS